MKVSVLGAGAWGTALASAFLEGENEVTLWSFDPLHVERMKKERENRDFFPGVRLSPELSLASDLGAVVREAEALVLVVPSHAFRSTLEKMVPFVSEDQSLVIATKGIELETGALLTEVVANVLGGVLLRPSVVLSGPSFASEVGKKLPTNLVAASVDADGAARLQAALSSEWLRVYTSDDPIGVEVGGALKNVIAIAAGASDGFGLGHNARAALVTRGIAEMSRFAVALGGNERTLAGLSGMGDLVLTCTGELSRNRTLGYKLARGMSLEEALASSQGVAEGYGTAKSAFELASKLGVELPIIAAVHSVLHEGKRPEVAMKELLARPLHAE